MTITSRPTSRRHMLASAAGAAVGLVAASALPTRARAAAQLTVADPGGPYSPGYRKAFYDPFEKATGVRVINVAREAYPTAQFKAMVQTGSYMWDVCTLTNFDRDILARQNLLEPIGLTSAVAPGLMSDGLTPLWLGIDVYATVLAYRTDHFKSAAPQNWTDVWNVAKFPGRRALHKSPIDTLEQALMADGVALDRLYPLDVERAFKSLDRIRPHVDVWWTGGAQSTQLLQSGEVDLCAMWNARAQAAIDGGTPAKIVWHQGLYDIEGWAVPKGCPRADLARQFVAFCADPHRQALFTETLSYGPTNLQAYADIPSVRAATLPTAPANLGQMTGANGNWWRDNRSAVTERFDAWLLG